MYELSFSFSTKLPLFLVARYLSSFPEVNNVESIGHEYDGFIQFSFFEDELIIMQELGVYWFSSDKEDISFETEEFLEMFVLRMKLNPFRVLVGSLFKL